MAYEQQKTESMTHNVDFILPSCYGIPESMWLVASAMLNAILKKCWLLLGAFVVVKMIVSTFMDLGEERFSLGTQFRILAQAFLIAIFLNYYKTCLMTFDYMIDSLCFFKVEVMQQTVSNTEKIVSARSTITHWLLKAVGEIGNFFLFTQQGVTHFMHYIKSVSLLILSILGPFSALFSLLPGPFKASFKTWSKGYVNVSCWTITLAILDVLATTFQATTGQEGYRVMLSFVLFIMTFFVPTWTAKLIGNVNLGNVAAGIGTGIGKTYTGAREAYKEGKKLFTGRKEG